MKPLQLTLDFFGPYRHQVIDFSKFEQQSMFLISGPTGAGKSTIFDGLVFALYGSGSGPQRQPQDFRSEFATPADETSVTATFLQRGQRYQVVRKPAQVQQKQRGNGTTEAKSQAILTIYQDETAQTEVKQLTKVKQVNLYLSELLQMNADQFRQIVLLPQGEFRQFLDGDSDQKEAVLRNLFQTQRYERWVEQIQLLYKTASAKNKTRQDQLAFLTEQIQWQADFAPAPAATATLAERQAQGRAQATWLSEQLQQQRANQAQLNQTVDQQRAQFSQTQQLAAAFQQRRTVQQQQAQLVAQQAQIDHVQAQLDQQTWAQQQQPALVQFQHDQQQLQDWQQQLTTIKQQFAQATDQQAQLQTQQQVLMAQQPEQTALQGKVTRWQALQPLYEEVEQLKNQLNQQQTSQQAAQAKLTELQTAQVAGQAQLAATTTQQQTYQTLPEQLLEWNQRTQQLLNWQSQAQALAQAQVRVSNSQQQLRKLTQQLQKQTATHEEAEQQYRQQKSDFAAVQIALLSRDLVPDAPCPVCGSTTHPHPAVVPPDQKVVTQEQVEQADQARQLAAQALTRQQIELANQQEQLQTQQATNKAAGAALITALQETGWLTVTDDITVATVINFLDQQVQTVQAHQAVLVAQQKTAHQLAAQVMTLTSAQERMTAASQEQATVVQQQASQLMVLQTQLTDKQQQLPTEFPTLAQLTTFLTASRQKLTNYQTALEENQTGRQQQQQRLAKLEADRQHYLARQQETTTQLEQQQAQLDQQLASVWPALSFEQRCVDLQKLLEQSLDLKALAQQVSDYQHERIRLETLLAELQKQLTGVTVAPDVTAAQSKLQALIEQATQQQKQLTTRENQLAQLQDILHQLTTISGQINDLTSLQELAEVTRGLGSQKLGLERYVLQMYLNEVLKVANVRLSQLTAGRYQLTLAAELGNNRKNSGLELNVYDDYTGDYRSVRTLSGGESFIAALALALALGEVVQQQTGAIEINTLFVDEGFGSLDEASLQTAINALTGLEGQQRLIGIISHVRELQAQLPNQLQVIPDGNGESHVKYQVATE